MKDIVQEPHPVLRQKAAPVPINTIASPEIQAILADMNTALDTQDDGVAIAAPQIGVSLRIFIVSKKASKQFSANTAFINPEIIRVGKIKEEMSEGCLSVRWKYGTVKRSTTATVRALNASGNEFVVNGRGLLAQIFQHETDHLNGTLFIDKAKNIEDTPPQE
ncbi:peptide deformylase [Patescibacteria group bacterium]|nr:peptide deformylase [Patescibacteria group bacterium]